MIFRNDIINCYNNYQKLYPLDITTKKKYNIWEKKYKLNLLNYSRIVGEIRDLKSIYEIIKSDFDYDNLYIVIESLINANFLKIDENGAFLWKGLEKNIFKNDIELCDIFNNPNNNYNQFPCDKSSRVKRINLFYELFPYVKEMNIGILGDDDLLSIELFKTGIYKPIVYEIDEKVISIINKETENQIKIISIDFLNKEYITKFYIDTFITDPPYNLNGLLQFINFGLSQINREVNEFFVIFNKMMIGNSYNNLTNKISKKGYNISNIINGFSVYNFPLKYRELKDINKKLTQYGINFTDKNFSSSIPTI